MSTLRVHSITHVPFETIGTIADWLRDRSCRHTATALHANETLPRPDEFDLLIIMGGPMSANDEAILPWMSREKALIAEATEAGKGIVGICLGAQLVASVLGARVHATASKEIGWHPVEMDPLLFPGARPHQQVFHWHGETFDLPPGARRIASNEACTNQAFLYGTRVFGLQFHLEMSRETVESLVVHAANELVPAPFVQSAGEIRAGNAHAEENRKLMYGLLDRLLAEWRSRA